MDLTITKDFVKVFFNILFPVHFYYNKTNLLVPMRETLGLYVWYVHVGEDEEEVLLSRVTT